MKKKVVRVSKFSKLIFSLLIIMVLVTPVISIGSKGFISKLNFDVENLENDIDKLENENESLTMKINQLSSLENIQEIAKEYGLYYNNDNIKVVLK